MEKLRHIDVLVIGSGAGGSVTALVTAASGMRVLVLEEGGREELSECGDKVLSTMARMYRRRGMTPILGSVPIGYVEGCCVGGSTEINCAFWQRTPKEILLRWKAQYDLQAASQEDLAPHFEWAEERLNVSSFWDEWPGSTQRFAEGIRAMGWSPQEVPRAAERYLAPEPGMKRFPNGINRSMTRSLIPMAEQAGATFAPNCKAELLLKEGRKVTGVLARRSNPDGSQELLQIMADHIFVCAGATETPSLLGRSGIRFHVGDSLSIHPMVKVAARFDEPVNAHENAMPLLQVKEFWPEITLGGSFFSVGHLALVLSENWPATRDVMTDFRCFANYYAAVKGTGRGSVRPSLHGDPSTYIHYELSDEDVRHLSRGLARLATLLLASGAREVYPCVYGVAPIRSELDAIKWLDETLPRKSLSLTTVHAFSSCPMGERLDRCAADSFGKVFGFNNLFINDASMLPDSSGVNPQGSVMAMARRNAIHFRDRI